MLYDNLNSFNRPGLQSVGQYLMSGRSWVTGSILSGSNEVAINFPQVTKEFTVNNLSSSALRVHFQSKVYTQVESERYYLPLSGSRTSFKFRTREKRVYISLENPLLTGSFLINANLTGLDRSLLHDNTRDIISASYFNLSRAITINNTTVSQPSGLYLGNAATNSTWAPVIGNPTAALYPAGGGNPTGSTYGIYGPGAQFNNGQRYFNINSTTTNNPGLSDYITEIIFKYVTQTANDEYLLTLLNNAGGTLSLTFNNIANNTVDYLMTSVTITAPNNTLVNGNYYHLLVFCNRNLNTTNGLLMYINGSLVAQGNASAHSAVNITNDANARGYIGGAGDGATTRATNSAIYYIASYYTANWFNDTNTTMLADANAFALARYNSLYFPITLK